MRGIGENEVNIEHKKERLGQSKYTKNGNYMTIVKYNKNDDIIVEFKDGSRRKISYIQFKRGNVTSPYDKTVYGVGYLGVGKYKVKDENGNLTINYRKWNDMIRRCHSIKKQKDFPRYKGCSICEEWYDFQVFSKWFSKNYYEIDGETMCLDKDILIKGNKVYSPETCIIVPNNINVLFVKSNSTRGKYPIGVCYHKTKGYFLATLSLNKRHKEIGRFETPTEAFSAYKVAKELHIKEVADKYKTFIPRRLYDSMYNYEVEIND